MGSMSCEWGAMLRNWAAACYFQVYLRCRVLGRTGRPYKWCANFNQELHPLNLMSSDIRSLVEGITCEICFFYLFMTFWPFLTLYCPFILSITSSAKSPMVAHFRLCSGISVGVGPKRPNRTHMDRTIFFPRTNGVR